MPHSNPALLLESTRPLPEPANVAIQDLDILFTAATARLRSLAEPRPGNAATEAARVRSSILECVQALEQLHATALHEVSRLHRLEAECEAPPCYRGGHAHCA